jgi:hypothetical protein
MRDKTQQCTVTRYRSMTDNKTMNSHKAHNETDNKIMNSRKTHNGDRQHNNKQSQKTER